MEEADLLNQAAALIKTSSKSKSFEDGFFNMN